MKLPGLVISCEHASFGIPREFRSRFSRAGKILRSHRGHDEGAAEMAREFSRRWGAPLVLADFSRLLIDMNRSAHHPRLFSEFSRSLPLDRKQQLLAMHTAYRGKIRRALGNLKRPVIHLCIHSFTPRLGGVTREAEFGILYDPSRPAEKRLAALVRRHAGEALPGWRIRRNYPYRGVSDGLPVSFRQEGNNYTGLELEFNQALFKKASPRVWAGRLTPALERAVLDFRAR